MIIYSTYRIVPVASALALIAMPALSQTVTTSPFDLDIGGFATLGVGYADTAATSDGRSESAPGAGDGTDGQPVQIVNDAEIHFNFSLTADNGLRFGFKAEMEANGAANNMDEYVGSVRGGFGTLELGVEDGAHDRLTDFFADYTFVGVSDGDGLLFDFADSGVIVPDTAGGDTGDDFKITYFSPTIAGLRAGVSYATGSEGGTSNDETDNSGEGIEAGLRYEAEFGAFSVALGGGYTFFTDDDDDDGWTLGTILGFAGAEASAVVARENADKTSFAIGLSYGTGPWLGNVSYAQMLEYDTVAEADDAFGVTAEISYALAPGVRTGLGVEYASDTFAVDNDGDILRDADGRALDNSSGFAAGLFLGLTF